MYSINVPKNFSTSRNINFLNFCKWINIILRRIYYALHITFHVSVLKPSLLEEVPVLSNNKPSSSLKEKISFEEFEIMSFEKCNNFYKKKLLVANDKNEHFSKNINVIFKEMYVDEIFVPLCQHMVELCGKLI